RDAEARDVARPASCGVNDRNIQSRRFRTDMISSLGTLPRGDYSSSSLRGVSVILCCHNSVTRLKPTLAHLAGQSGIGEREWEIVLVDNASTDQTASHAQSLWQSFGAPSELRVVSEPNLGLIHARVTGISSAGYEILTFVDDDNWISPL